MAIKKDGDTGHSETLTMQIQRKNTWQKTAARRTVSIVKQDVENVIAQSPFLQETTRCGRGQNVGLFHRSEIQTGQLLGRGGFSDVYEITGFRLNPVVTRQLNESQRSMREWYADNSVCPVSQRGRYAIKQLQPRLLEAPNQDFQFAATDLALEAVYLSSFDHPHILSARGLPVLGLSALANGRHDGYFIITDRLEKTLDRTIREWRNEPESAPPVETKAQYASQIASAISYLHERRIVFRDLKPHNIGFATGTNQIQLFDFGLCRELPEASSEAMEDVYEMSGVGTRRYMATEVINTGKYNLKVDVYSWAMVFWEILNHVRPFASYSLEDHELYVCHRGERPPLGDSCGPLTIRNLLQMAWAESIEERLSIEEVVIQLKSFMESKKQGVGQTCVMPLLRALSVTSMWGNDSGDSSRRSQSGASSSFTTPGSKRISWKELQKGIWKASDDERSR